MESLQRFWAVVVEVWNTGILGVSLGRILVAVGIVLLCLLMRRLFIRVVSGRLRAWTKRSKTKIDDQVIVALEKPIGLIPVVLGSSSPPNSCSSAAPWRCSPPTSLSRSSSSPFSGASTMSSIP